jgi:hypothetical protein
VAVPVLSRQVGWPHEAHQQIEIVIIPKGEQPTFEEELAKDVLEIITVFSARLYGSRSKKNKDLMEVMKIEDLNVAGMLKNRCLSRSIADTGFALVSPAADVQSDDDRRKPCCGRSLFPEQQDLPLVRNDSPHEVERARDGVRMRQHHGPRLERGHEPEEQGGKLCRRSLWRGRLWSSCHRDETGLREAGSRRFVQQGTDSIERRLRS